MDASRNATLRDKVATLTDAGLTPREIAPVLNVSVQWVYELLRDMDKKPAKRHRKEATA